MLVQCACHDALTRCLILTHLQILPALDDVERDWRADAATKGERIHYSHVVFTVPDIKLFADGGGA